MCKITGFHNSHLSGSDHAPHHPIKHGGGCALEKCFALALYSLRRDNIVTAPITSQVPPPRPSTGRSGLAELNVRQPVTAPAPEPSPLSDQLLGLTEVVDDLLPSGRRHRR